MKKAMTRVPLTVLGLALGAVCATTARAQEILPFPPAPSGSTAGLTMKDSTYKKRVEPKRLAEGAPNILIILMDDVGPGTPSTYGGEIRTPTLDRVAKMGVSFNRFHSTAMCSPTRAALLTGRNHTLRRQWPDLGDRQRLRRLQRDHPEVVGDRRRSAQELRLQHRGLGQVAQHARGADHLQGAVRLLADRLRLRVLLRLPGRRGFAVRADPDAQHHRGHRRDAQGLPPHRRHRDGRDQVAARTEGLRAGQAVLHVLGAGRLARPAPGHEGMGRQVQGQVRRRLGQVPRARLRARQGQGLDPARTPSSRRAPLPWPPGTRSPRPRSRSSAASWRSSPGFTEHADYNAGRVIDEIEKAGQARQHADLLHLGRQRLLVRGPQRHHQRAAGAERDSDQDLAAPRGAEGARRARRARRPEDRQHVPRRLGVGGQHAVPGHQAHGRLLRRHPPADGRLLAEPHQGRSRRPGRSSTTSSTSCRRSTS